MSASDQPTCGKWMPRSRAYCARSPQHHGECRTAKALEDHRQRKTERRRGKTLDTPEARAKWRRAHKFVRFGITEERFNRMLAAQGYACGICREPFGDGRICIDHDHACCPVSADGRSRSCGECVRGLLCVRCNTWLGWMDKYGKLARAYLASPRPWAA